MSHKEALDKALSMGRLEPYFERAYPNVVGRTIAKLLAVTIAMTLVFTTAYVGIGLAYDAANSASQRCVTESGKPCTAPQYAVKKFKNGKMGRSHGVKPSKIFANPKVAKRIFVRKIQRKLDRRYGRSAAPHSASWYYREALDDATCVGTGTYSPYSSGFDVCVLEGPETKMTKEDIQNTGAVTFCLGSVAFGAATAGSGYLITGWGAASCTWSLWLAATN